VGLRLRLMETRELEFKLYSSLTGFSHVGRPAAST
jgi:hypothetical protein